MRRLRVGLGVLLAVVLVAQTAFASITFDWSGSPIVGEDPNYFPSGTAEFAITGNVLTITLTNTSSMQMGGLGEVFTGLTWNITDAGVSLTPVSAMVAPGSSVVGNGATPDVDISSEWAFRDDLVGYGLSGMGTPIGPYGLGSMGDVNFMEAFGPHERFDTTTNLWGPASPNGVQAGIVSQIDGANLFSPPFANKGPFVQDQVLLTFDITGDLQESEIVDVVPLFGTDGATIVPEPATVVIWSLIGALGFSAGWWRSRRRNTAAAPSLPARRAPWSDQARSSIADIFERGRRF